MIARFDELVKQRKQLAEWWKLKTTMAAYDRTHHSLRVDVSKPSLISFCGQQYAGAKNYHDAPSFFFEDVRKEFQDNAAAITEAAYHRKMRWFDAEIAALRRQVEAELEAANAE